jgi:D-hexose-6-phosphate mutarotase
MENIKNLRKLTKTQLTAEITRGKSKRDMLIEANGGLDVLYDDPIYKHCKDGQIEYQEDVSRDIETDEITEIRQILWTYYDTGEVDEITIHTLGDKETTKVIKHFRDGRQPEVKEI